MNPDLNATYMKKMRLLITASVLMLAGFSSNAQIGIGTTNPQGALDITSTTDGLLVPRVALALTTTATVTTPTESELVYNTATAGDVTPGYYYWDSAKWVRLAVGSPTGWALTGNTVANATSYMGTNDNFDVIFKRFGARAGKLGLTETSWGLGALNVSAGSNNTGIGLNALLTNSSGSSNIAIGTNALAANTTTNNNTAVGHTALAVNTAASNTAIGSTALSTNTTGASNVAVGFGSMTGNVLGSQSTAVGYNALAAATGAGTPNNNTAIGYRALFSNTVGSNTAVGASALSGNTGGTGNTAVGVSTLTATGNSGFNTALGYFALNANTGQWNTAIGYNALVGISGAAGQNNVAVGFAALSKVGGAQANMNQNTAVGSQALQNNETNDGTAVGNKALTANTSGLANTALGQSALMSNTTGSQSTAVGAEALFSNNGGSNTGVGYQALRNNTGASNVGIGWQAGMAGGAATDNVFIGTQAGDATTGSSNVFVGKNSGNNNTSGSFNVALGVNAGNNHTTASNNVNVGYQTGFVNAGANVVNIGTQAGFANGLGGGVNIGYQAGYNEVTANKLYIANSAATATGALIYGDFTTGAQILRTNSTFQINDPATSGYVFPTARGAANQFLALNGSGVLAWTTPSANNTLSVVRANLSANQSLTGIPAGWEKINFNTKAYDTNTEFVTGTGTFTAATAGYYQINAGYHTDGTGTVALFGIAIYVNGSLYRENTYDSTGGGTQVSRNVTCTAMLAVGNTVEIYVRNPDAGRNIDSFSGKTYFEVVQIR
jgi:hypothetical protein